MEVNHHVMSNLSQELIQSVASNDLELVKILTQNNSDLDIQDRKGQTALMQAVYGKNIAAAKILIEAGANVNTKDETGNSPFLLASAMGLYEIVALCLANGADFSIYNRFGGSALIHAAGKGHVEVVRLLASYPGFPVNHINRLGWTAMMESVVVSDGGAKHLDIMKILITAGADVSIADWEGITALTHAKQRGFLDIAKVLEN